MSWSSRRTTFGATHSEIDFSLKVYGGATVSVVGTTVHATVRAGPTSWTITFVN